MSRRSNNKMMRTCIGCNRRDSRDRLLRLVRSPLGRLEIDVAKTARGRGGYLHFSDGCWTRFARGKGTIRSLRAVVPAQARKALLDELRSGVEI